MTTNLFVAVSYESFTPGMQRLSQMEGLLRKTKRRATCHSGRMGPVLALLLIQPSPLMSLPLYAPFEFTYFLKMYMCAYVLLNLMVLCQDLTIPVISQQYYSPESNVSILSSPNVPKLVLFSQLSHHTMAFQSGYSSEDCCR